MNAGRGECLLGKLPHLSTIPRLKCSARSIRIASSPIRQPLCGSLSCSGKKVMLKSRALWSVSIMTRNSGKLSEPEAKDLWAIPTFMKLKNAKEQLWRKYAKTKAKPPGLLMAVCTWKWPATVSRVRTLCVRRRPMEQLTYDASRTILNVSS